MMRFIADGLGLPPNRVMLFLGALFAAILIGGIWLYQDKTYPHGPKYLTEEFGEVREDTSRLNNPIWVTFIRKIQGLFFFATAGLALGAFFAGIQLNEPFRNRRNLLVLDDRLRFLVDYQLAHSGPSFQLIFDRFITNLMARRWTASEDFLQQLRRFEPKGRMRPEDVDDSGDETWNEGETLGPYAIRYGAKTWDENWDQWQTELQRRKNSLEEINWPGTRDVDDLLRDYGLHGLTNTVIQ